MTPRTSSPPGSSVHGILQARILEWVAIPFSRGSSSTQRSNSGLLHCRQVLYRLSYRLSYPIIWLLPLAFLINANHWRNYMLLADAGLLCLEACLLRRTSALPYAKQEPCFFLTAVSVTFSASCSIFTQSGTPPDFESFFLLIHCYSPGWLAVHFPPNLLCIIEGDHFHLHSDAGHWRNNQDAQNMHHGMQLGSISWLTHFTLQLQNLMPFYSRF